MSATLATFVKLCARPYGARRQRIFDTNSDVDAVVIVDRICNWPAGHTGGCCDHSGCRHMAAAA